MINQIKTLFINRTDTYALQWYDNQCKKKKFKRINALITDDIIRNHLAGRTGMAAYQLDKSSLVKWGCYDFDKDTSEDFEQAKDLYQRLINLGLCPLAELSGGGDYKVHIWLFSDPIPAVRMKTFLKNIPNTSNEIFPKQDHIDKDGYGNFVKLPIGINLATNKFSFLLDDDFKPITDPVKVIEKLDFHIKNKSLIPEVSSTFSQHTKNTVAHVGTPSKTAITTKRSFLSKWNPHL